MNTVQTLENRGYGVDNRFFLSFQQLFTFPSFLISSERNQLRNKHFFSFCTILLIVSVLRRKLNGTLKILLMFHFRKQSPGVARAQCWLSSCAQAISQLQKQNLEKYKLKVKQLVCVTLLFLYLDLYDSPAMKTFSTSGGCVQNGIFPILQSVS